MTGFAKLGLPIAAVAVAAAVAACAPARERAPAIDPSIPPQVRETFTAAYGGIVEKYLDTVAVGRVAVEGLRGLGAIDPGLTVNRSGDTVTLAAANQVVATFAAPRDDDVRGWAALTADVSAAGRRASRELERVPVDKVYEAVFDGALAKLDVFSRYAGPEEARKNRARREGFGGIGIHFEVKDGAVRVTSVIEGTPADAAGLRKDDRITDIDGVATEGMDNPQVVDKLRGPVNSQVVVVVAREGVAEPLRFQLQRAHIVPDTVTSRDEGGVIILKVTGFNQDTVKNLSAALKKAQAERPDHLKGVVLDLRGNPGGLLKQSISMADLFLTEGAIVSARGRHPDSVHYYAADTGELARGLPMVVVVDGKSASAAEIVASALQDRGRAVVVGTASYGKGTVQTVIRLPNDGEITLTWSRLFAPSGYPLHGLGVRPTICTSGLTGDGGGLVAAILAERTKTADALAAWRKVGVDDDDRRRALRASCPAEPRPHSTEIEVARQLLADHALYAHALDLTAPPATASSESRRP